ncbi:MAG: hypothetical protein NT092_10220 [Bacteroidia bacterium]|nr:hypothetical protein [Bacteroidia bacterium]
MKIIKLLCLLAILLMAAGCAPFDKIYSHEFDSGYYKLKSEGSESVKIYLNLKEDSLAVYPVMTNRKIALLDTSAILSARISSVKPGNYFYNSLFIRTSPDIDLSTVLLKFRPEAADVQSQLSANVNGIFYAGYRKDFFRVKSHLSPLRDINTFIRHTGLDFGLFAGIGITPVNPTTTMNQTAQEYDGVVFQKGVSIFGTFENMSVGLALGFDNLLDNNKDIWIYNWKPWIGIAIGIANF